MPSPTVLHRSSLSGQHWRAAVAAAVEALEAGDDATALTILLDQLEADGPTDRPFRCPHCPAAYEWPGQLQHHLFIAHPMAEAA